MDVTQSDLSQQQNCTSWSATCVNLDFIGAVSPETEMSFDGLEILSGISGVNVSTGSWWVYDGLQAVGRYKISDRDGKRPRAAEMVLVTLMPTGRCFYLRGLDRARYVMERKKDASYKKWCIMEAQRDPAVLGECVQRGYCPKYSRINKRASLSLQSQWIFHALVYWYRGMKYGPPPPVGGQLPAVRPRMRTIGTPGELRLRSSRTPQENSCAEFSHENDGNVGS
ncbi:hypothetical protein JB92DRAFT_2833828 [Gautieria morchelliformis]|nr:hypothetical protein JB92DRAFT_2833828 [Gautieria morchelliformis]